MHEDWSSYILLQLIFDIVQCETSTPHLDTMRNDRLETDHLASSETDMKTCVCLGSSEYWHLRVARAVCGVQVLLELYCTPLCSDIWENPCTWMFLLLLEKGICEMKTRDVWAVKILYGNVCWWKHKVFWLTQYKCSCLRSSSRCTSKHSQCAVGIVSNSIKIFYTFLQLCAVNTSFGTF